MKHEFNKLQQESKACICSTDMSIHAIKPGCLVDPENLENPEKPWNNLADPNNAEIYKNQSKNPKNPEKYFFELFIFWYC